MAKTSSLQLLVNSLSKGEKRYFKLYTSLQQGGKDYLYLFGLLEKGTELKQLKKSFIKKKPGSSFEAAAKYLFKVITDCLLHIRADHGRSARLVMALLKTNILFEKSMYEEGFRQLQKIQESAREYEQYIIQLWAARIELYYLCNVSFNGISEKELIRKQMKIDELLKYARNIHQHTSLYELLRHRLLHKGGARTKMQKEELNDLVVAELNLTSNPLAETFESHKTHLLFQSHYFITINDHKSALKTFYELNNLLEEHHYLWADSPMDYLSAVEGILESLHTIRRYADMHFFLDKLKNILHQSAYLDMMAQRVIFIYRLIGLLDQGEFEKAILLQQEFEEILFRKIHLLDLSKQAEVYLYTAMIYMGCGKISRAHYYLNKILLESKLYYSLPVYRTFRLLHLLVHDELGNHDYIASETRSIKRALSASRSKAYLLEKIIFTFVRQSPVRASARNKDIQLKKIKKAFEEIRSDKYEIQLLKIFDFESWITAKISGRSFRQTVQEKYTTATL